MQLCATACIADVLQHSMPVVSFNSIVLHAPHYQHQASLHVGPRRLSSKH